MKLPRKLYLLVLVLVPMALSGVMGVGLTRWVAAELESDSLADDLRSELQRLQVLRSNMEKESREETIPRLPQDPGVAEFLSQIEKAVGRSGITCDTVTVAEDQEPGQQIYEVGGKGDAGQIARFLAILEADPRIPIVDELRVFATDDDKTCFHLDLLLFHKIGAPKR
jgi:hypothetical protein